CARRATAGGWSLLWRFDWAWTADGRWKLLELNSDTPAGLWETGAIAGDVARLHRAASAPSASFWQKLAGSRGRCAAQAPGKGAPKRVRSVGLVGALDVPEDADQLRAHARAAQLAFPRARRRLGTVDDLAVRGGRVTLDGQPLDLVYRYYPLDWLAEPRWSPLPSAVADRRGPMPPPPPPLSPPSQALPA